MSLREVSISGVKWNSVASANNAIVQLIKLMFLARLLTKQELGLMTVALIVVGLSEIFANLGLNVGMIHQKDVSPKQYSSIFWLNLGLSLLLFGLLWLLSPLLATLYHEPSLHYIIPILGLQLPISAFGKIFHTFKIKELQFKFISIVSIVSVEIGAIATIFLAWHGWGAYSLVFGFLLQSLLQQLIYAISGLKKYKILFYCTLKEIKTMLTIGGFQVGTQVMDYFSSQLDKFIVGFFGMETLGVYGYAKEFIMRILNTITPIITNVATPAFATFQDQLELIRERYCKVLKIITAIDFPIFLVLAMFAEPVTLLIYGSDMMAVAPFLRIFAIWGILISVSSPAGILLVSLGRTDLGFIWTIVRIICTFIAIGVASFISIQAVAWAQTLSAVLFFFLYWRVVIFPITQIKFKKYLKTISKPSLFALGASLPVLYFLLSTQPIYMALIAVVIYGVVYLLEYYWWDKYFFMEMLLLIGIPNFLSKRLER